MGVVAFVIGFAVGAAVSWAVPAVRVLGPLWDGVVVGVIWVGMGALGPVVRRRRAEEMPTDRE
jgi:uncharacterized membrane protein